MNGHRTWSSALRYLGSLSALTMLALPLAGCGESAPDGSVVTGTEAVAEVSSELSHCVTIQRTGAALGAVVDSQIVTDPVDPSKASTNFGSLQVLNVGYVGTDYRQALYKFDLSGIPVGSVVTSADLSLRMLQSPGKADLNIHAVTAPWSESTVTWNSLGYAYDPSPAASAPTLGVTNNTPMSIDVTGLVGSWVSGAAANEGLLVDHPNAGRTTLGTSEAPSLAPRPKLTVCYDDPSCTDGVQNQGETGVDCGGPCAPCQVGVSGWYFANYPGSNGTFDPTQQYNGTVSCGTTCGALGMTAIGARFICNLDGVGSTEGCTAATDGQYGTANCGWMMENNVAQTQNGNTEECSSGIGSCVSSSCSESVTYHAIECQCQGVAAATCSDGIQNQGETGLDCGGPCAACPAPNAGWYFANYPGSNGTFDPTQQYNGTISCPTTCGALGLTATGARFICNLDGVGSTEGCTAATDGQYGTANCGWMMQSNVAQTQNGNTEECSSGIGNCVSSSCSEGVTYHAIECECQ